MLVQKYIRIGKATPNKHFHKQYSKTVIRDLLNSAFLMRVDSDGGLLEIQIRKDFVGTHLDTLTHTMNS